MAAVDYFLKIDDMGGESQDAKHKGEIDVESWSWGESNMGTHAGGGGGGAGKVMMRDFSFTMKVNKATPKLMLACATGQHLRMAVLVCRKAGKDQQEYLTITFSDLLVSGYQTGGHPGDVTPIDLISMNFARIEYEYREQKPDGTLGPPTKVGYDLKANQAI